MDVRGKAYINKGQYGFYTTVKDRDDTKVFLTVGFRKGQEPEDGGEFNLKNAFLSAYPTKSGDAKLKLVVLEYEQTGTSAPKIQQNSAPSGAPFPEGVTFEEDNGDGELPF